MTPGTLGLIVASVSLSALAQVSFKLGVSAAPVGGGRGLPHVWQTLLTPGVVGGLALYGIGTLLWLTALGRIDVSKAYPFVGLGFVLTALLGDVLFGENVGLQRMVGMLIVLGGILVVARS